MSRFFADGFIVSKLKVIWKCTALNISLFDPTIDSDIKTVFIQWKNSIWNELHKLLFN